MSFDELLDAIEELDTEEKELLMEILSNRSVEKRRNVIALNAKSVLDEIESGSAMKGTYKDLINELEK